MPEDIFDIVNQRDEVIGRERRSVVHARGLLHRAIHVLVFNARGHVFLQKRSLKKDRQPDVWDSSCSGHVDSGEDYDQTAVRELREEIGLQLTAPPQRLFKINACEETDAEFVWVYRCANEGPFQLHPDEIETGDWFTPKYVSQWIAEKPHDFAPAFMLIWKLFLQLNGTIIAAVRESIIKAFANVSYPGDAHITDHEDCPECDDIKSHFCGTTWQGHTIKELSEYRSALSLFTPRALQYFLPAFMLASLEAWPEAGEIPFSIMHICLPPEPDEKAGMKQYGRERFEILTPAQRDAIAAYLREWADSGVPFVEAYAKNVPRAVEQLLGHWL